RCKAMSLTDQPAQTVGRPHSASDRLASRASSWARSSGKRSTTRIGSNGFIAASGKISQNLQGGQPARCPGDTAAGMVGAAAGVVAADRGAVLNVAGRGPGEEHLRQAQLAVEDVAAGDAGHPL